MLMRKNTYHFIRGHLRPLMCPSRFVVFRMETHRFKLRVAQDIRI